MADHYLILERKYKKSAYTIGNLYRQSEKTGDFIFMCNVLEDTVRNPITATLNRFVKVFGETAIPYGTYEIVRTKSPRFKKILPELLKVPHYSGVRIHTGNKATDTEGCLLPGWNTKPGMVTDSRKAFEMVDRWVAESLKSGKVYIRIVDKA